MTDRLESLSPLAKFIQNLLLEPAGEALRRQFVERLTSWQAGNWSALLEIGNDLSAAAKSHIKRQNSSKTLESAVEAVERRTGVNPIVFHRAYVSGLKFLRDTDMPARPKKVREAVLDQMRPDLSLDVAQSSRERSRIRAERERIDTSLKGMLEKPSGPLRVVFSIQKDLAEP